MIGPTSDTNIWEEILLHSIDHNGFMVNVLALHFCQHDRSELHHHVMDFAFILLTGLRRNTTYQARQSECGQNSTQNNRATCHC